MSRKIIDIYNSLSFVSDYNNNGLTSGSNLVTINTYGILTLNSTQNSTDTSTGALVIPNGGVAINANVNATGTANGGGLTVSGGGAFSQDVYVGGNLNISGAIISNASVQGSNSFNYLTLTATDNSINLSTGSLVTIGGISIQAAGNATSSTSGGGITIAGGAAIRRDIYVGGTANLPNIVSTNISSNNVRFTNITSSTLNITNGITAVNTLITSGTITNLLVTNSLNAIFNSNTIGSIFTTGGNVGINTSTPGYQLDISGNLRVNSTSLNIFSANTLGDVLQIQNTNASGASTLQFLNNTGSSKASFGIGNSNNTQFQNTVYLSTISGVPIQLSAGGNTTFPIIINSADNSLSITSTTTSNSISSGALKVSGGAGINGNLYVAGGLFVNSQIAATITNTTVSSNSTTGAVLLSGGLSINILNTSNANATSYTSGGALTINGGAAISQNVYISGLIDIASGSNNLNSISLQSIQLYSNSGSGAYSVIGSGNASRTTSSFTPIRFTGWNDQTNPKLTINTSTIDIFNAVNATNNTNTIGNIFTTGGNVGVGTTQPGFNLDVSGNINFSGALYKNSTLYVSSQWVGTNGTLLTYGSTGSGALVGINTTNPSFTLDVAGTSRISTSLTTGSIYSTNQTTTNIVGTNISSLNLLSNFVTTGSLLSTNLISTANVYTTNITTTNLVSVNNSFSNLILTSGTFSNKVGGSQTVGTIVVTTSASLIGNTNTIGNLFTTGGNVGINTVNPAFTLDISGTLRITNSLTTANVYSTNITSTNVFATNITSSSLISNLITTNSLLSTNLISTANVYTTNITTTNLVSVNNSFSNLILTSGTFTNFVGGSQTVGTIVVTTSASLICNTNTIGNLFTTGGNVGINTTSPNFTFDVNGTGRFTNLTSTTNTIGNLNNTNLISTNITTTNLISTNSSLGIINSTSLTTGNINFTGNLYQNGIAYLGSQWTTTAGNLSYTSGNVIVSGNISSSGLISTNASLGSLSASNISISGNMTVGGNLIVAGTLIAVNITSVNIIDNNISAGTLNAGSGTFISINSGSITSTNIVGTNISSLNLLSNFVTIGSLLSTNLISTNITTTNLVSINNSFSNLILTSGTFANKVGGSQTVGTIVVTTSASLIGNTNTIGNLFTTGGNVGINTVNPQFTLDISGTTRITNSLITTNVYSTNVTSTNIVGTNISSINLLSNFVTIGSLLSTNINSTNITSTNFVGINNSFTNLILTSGTFANLIASSQTVGTFVVVTSASLIGNTNTIGNLFTTGGNVGINTTSPQFTLDVIGTGRFTNLTSTTNTIGTLNNTNFISTNSSISSLNVVSLLSTNSSLGIINSTGLTTGNINFTGNLFQNSIPYVGSQWTTTAGNLSYTSGNVIVSGNISSSGLISNFASVGSLSGANISISGNITVGGNLLVLGSLISVNITTTNFIDANITAGTLNANTATITNLVVLTNSSLGTINSIGLTTGNINFTGNLYQNGVSYLGSQWTTSSGNLTYTSGTVIVSGLISTTNLQSVNLTAGTLNVINGLTTGNINFTGSLYQNGVSYLGSQWTGTTGSLLYYGTTGNIFVGIGTTNPNYTLTVNGIISGTGLAIIGTTNSLNSTTGQYIFNSVSISTTQDVSSVTQGGALTISGGASFGKSIAVSGSVNYSGVATDIAGSFNAANNIVTPVNVTGLLFPAATIRSFTLTISIQVIATISLYAQYTIEGIQNATGWSIGDSYIGDNTGVSFNITNTGQITYTSANISGWSSTTFNYRSTSYSISANYIQTAPPTSGNYIITGNLAVQSTTDAINSSQGSIITNGGIFVAKSINIGTGIVNNNISVTSAGTFNGVNGQTIPANITGLLLSSVTYNSFTIVMNVVLLRSSGGNYKAQYTIEGIQKDSGWFIYVTSLGDTIDLTFSITSTGQLQYNSNTTYTNFTSMTFNYYLTAFYVTGGFNPISLPSGNSNINTLIISSTQDVINSTTASLVVAGGAAINLNLLVGGGITTSSLNSGNFIMGNSKKYIYSGTILNTTNGNLILSFNTLNSYLYAKVSVALQETSNLQNISILQFETAAAGNTTSGNPSYWNLGVNQPPGNSYIWTTSITTGSSSTAATLQFSPATPLRNYNYTLQIDMIGTAKATVLTQDNTIVNTWNY